MANEPTTTAPLLPLAEISSAMAPIIYFDAAPNFGFNNGVASLTLEAVVYVNVGDQIRAERRVVAHLRMTPGAFANLKSAINGLELAAEPTERKPANEAWNPALYSCRFIGGVGIATPDGALG